MTDPLDHLSEMRQPIDLYAKLTDHEGKVAMVATRVWNAERFMLARRVEANNQNLKHGSTKADAEQLTAEQFFHSTPRRAA